MAQRRHAVVSFASLKDSALLKAMPMSARSTETTVTFNHAFQIKGVDERLPPGTYLVVTEEERLDSLSFPAWHRTGTQLHLPAIATASATRQAVTIDPEDLMLALIADGRMPTDRSGAALPDIERAGVERPGVRPAGSKA